MITPGVGFLVLKTQVMAMNMGREKSNTNLLCV